MLAGVCLEGESCWSCFMFVGQYLEGEIGRVEVLCARRVYLEGNIWLVKLLCARRMYGTDEFQSLESDSGERSHVKHACIRLLI